MYHTKHAVLSLALSVLFCFLFLFIPQVNGYFLFNADALYLPALFRDFFDIGISALSYWNLTPNVYYFPDFVLYFFAHLLSFGTNYSVYVYAILQTWTVALLAFYLFRAVAGEDERQGWLLFPIVFWTLLFAAVFGGGLVSSAYMVHWYVYIMTSGHHFGGIVSALLCFLLMVLSLAPALGRFAILVRPALAAAVLATVLSDTLFLFVFPVPALAALGGYVLFVRFSWQVIKTGAAIGLASGAAYFIGKSINSGGTEYIKYITGNTAANALHNLAETFVRPSPQEQAFAFFIVFINFALLAISIRQALHARRQADGAGSAMPILAVAFSLSCLTVLIASVVTGVYVNIMTTRYLLPLSFFPLVFLAVVLAGGLGRVWAARPAVGVAVPAVLIAAVGVLSGVTLARDSSKITQRALLPIPPQLACFDSTRPVIGFGSYWPAKPLTFFSGNQVQVAQLTPDGSPFLWINSTRTYSENLLHPGEPVTFRFIIMDSLDKQAVAARYGQPDSIQKCSNTEIWWYTSRDDLAVAAYGQNSYNLLPSGYRRYVVGDVVDFSAAGNSNLYKKSGWYGVEPLGTWTKGKTAVLEFLLTEAPSSDLLLHMEAFPFIRPQHPRQEVGVVVNGESVATWVFSGVQGDGVLKTRIPAAIVNRQKPLRIEFRIANPFSPESVGESPDPRDLGLSVKTLRLLDASAGQ